MCVLYSGIKHWGGNSTVVKVKLRIKGGNVSINL